MSYNPGSAITIIKSFSSADILALNTANTLVVAQGVGTIIIPVSATCIYTYGTLAYVMGTMRLVENATPATGTSIMTNSTGINGLTGSMNSNFVSSAVTAALGSSIQTNQALQLWVSVSPTVGDGTMKIILSYIVITP